MNINENNALNENKSIAIGLNAEDENTAKKIKFKIAKKLNYRNYLFIVFVVILWVAIAFIIDKIVTWNTDFSWEFTTTTGSFICFLIWIIIGFIRNRRTVRFYGDQRRRYDSTYTIEEAKNRKKARIIFLIGLILLIAGIIKLIITLTNQ
ncbi:hypothetical protein [Mesoplasma corruscae]|uniref:DUF3899 domain-containing protein n=1 Tax=Mesoplasma corruscae TaxID=216874 RepID=A0A2S5RHE1_9MOLU|nr:hypothetical protein [Mesoplasma corruscae]PPE06720.1 hypothetical protein MCORR_v1c03510 [Mesoplasma corruscae]